MRVEEMALRSEIRQMLNEAGYNKDTLKELVKQVLTEQLERAIKQAINETDFNGYIQDNVNKIIRDTTRNVVKDRITDRIVGNYFNKMKVSVDIITEDDKSLTKENKENENN